MHFPPVLRSVLAPLLVIATVLQPFAMAVAGIDACGAQFRIRSIASDSCRCCTDDKSQRPCRCCTESAPAEDARAAERARATKATPSCGHSEAAPSKATWFPESEPTHAHLLTASVDSCSCNPVPQPGSQPAPHGSRDSDRWEIGLSGEWWPAYVADAGLQASERVSASTRPHAAHFAQRHLCVWLI